MLKRKLFLPGTFTLDVLQRVPSWRRFSLIEIAAGMIDTEPLDRVSPLLSDLSSRMTTDCNLMRLEENW